MNQSAAVAQHVAVHGRPDILILEVADDGADHGSASLSSQVRQHLPAAAITCVHGAHALVRALSTNAWRLVILQPGSNGLAQGDAMSALRLAAAQSPVILVAQRLDAATVLQAFRAGAHDVVDRAAIHELPQAVTRVLGAVEWQDERVARFAADRDWTLATCNAGALAILGFRADAIAGRSLDHLFPADADAQQLLDRIRQRSEFGAGHESGWMLRSDGLRMWADLSFAPERDVAGRVLGHCLIVRDATLQYRASRAVREHADRARDAHAARNLFIGSIAHELRAALGPIANAAHLLERQAEAPDRHGRLVQIIQRNAAAGARLVEDLLDYSTLPERKIVLRLTRFDVHGLLVEMVDAQRELALGKGLDLRLISSPGDAEVHADAGRVRQVIANLLGNAVKFTPRGGRITVRIQCDAQSVGIEVSDTGVGIDASVLPFIFDAFQQGGEQVTQTFGGFGLGLAISAAIASHHGGQLTASSDGAGRGATFRLVLPRGCLPAGQSPRDACGQAPAPSRADGEMRVLYVEDNADAADAMRYALGTLGWTMTHAGTCARARQLVAQAPQAFDVVLADLGLPDGSGIDLGRELSHELPVVALTAYGAPLAIGGFADQLIKPAEISEIQRALVSAVAHRRTSAGVS